MAAEPPSSDDERGARVEEEEEQGGGGEQASSGAAPRARELHGPLPAAQRAVRSKPEVVAAAAAMADANAAGTPPLTASGVEAVFAKTLRVLLPAEEAAGAQGAAEGAPSPSPRADALARAAALEGGVPPRSELSVTAMRTLTAVQVWRLRGVGSTRARLAAAGRAA